MSIAISDDVDATADKQMHADKFKSDESDSVVDWDDAEAEFPCSAQSAVCTRYSFDYASKN